MADDNNVQVNITADTSGLDDVHKSLAQTLQDFDNMQAAAKTAGTNAAASTAKATQEAKNLSGATAGVTREMVVLGREVATGNFSRLPGSLSIMAQRMGLLNTFLGPLIAGFAALGSVVVVGDWIGQFAALAEQINKVSQITGLSTDFLQDLNFAVQQTGGNVDSTRASIDHLEKSMEQAGDSTTQAAVAFKLMGVNTRDSEGNLRKVEDVLIDLAEFFSKTAAGSNKTTLGLAVLGQRATDLIPVLNRGVDGLGKLVEQLDATSSKMSGDQLKTFEQYAEKVKETGSAWEGFKLQTAESFEPAALTIIEDLTKIIELATQLTKVMSPSDWLANNPVTASLPLIGSLYSVMSGGGAKEQKPASASDDNSQQAPKLLTEKQIADAKKLAELTLQTDKEASEDKIGIKEQENANLLAIGAESNREYLAQQLQLVQDQKAIDADYYQKRTDAAQGNALELEKIKEQEQKSTQKLAIDQKKIQGQQLEESLSGYKTFFDGITSSWQNVTEQLIRGTTTWHDAFKTVLGDMVIQFAKMIEANIAKTLWAAIISKATSISVAKTSQLADATKAAAATYATVSEIPFVGWALAPPAAAAAFAGVLAFGLPSAAGGWESVPQDGLAMIHKKEMVLPAPVADKIRSMADSVGSGDSSGGDTHVHFNVSAMDSSSVQKFFKTNGNMIAKTIQSQNRNFNAAVPAWKS